MQPAKKPLPFLFFFFFFETIEAIYNFFSASTNRWAEFKQKLGVSMQRQSETRWSARDEAVRTVNCHFDELLNLLEDLTENGISEDTRRGAQALLQSMLKFEFFDIVNVLEQFIVIH